MKLKYMSHSIWKLKLWNSNFIWTFIFKVQELDFMKLWRWNFFNIDVISLDFLSLCMCYKGWRQQCTPRSIGKSSISSTSSRSGYYLISILISLIFYYFNVLLFSLLNFPILLQTFTAKRFWIHQFLWLSDSPEFSWVIVSVSVSLSLSISMHSQRASLPLYS